jgi:hypothetical protein
LPEPETFCAALVIEVVSIDGAAAVVGAVGCVAGAGAGVVEGAGVGVVEAPGSGVVTAPPPLSVPPATPF